ncbi:TetR/AcrR family transcriptional regulator [uncultured Desulfosarcina sp.]|uniref:TetR/AcrR family transcriptional regulator n=1 Tax=uncultured Desulfosarcina sp. TaxID=218289 RepID=UPI0029C64F74|nr:TetR/AcrR family transcriptional regulator [uncultured Desulfosarcina sp.]
MEKYHKETFSRIPAEKQLRILDTAVAEFAAKGFPGANINVIAKKAGISIGAMYKYFGSKEDLFLTIIERAHGLLEGVLDDIERSPGDIFDKIEKMVRAAQTYARKFPELHQIYLDMTSEGLSHMSRKLSGKMESISAQFYETLIQHAMAQGTIDGRLNPRVTALCIDNLILMLQFSYTSDYFKERMKLFLGSDALTDDEKIVRGVMGFIRGGLLAQSRLI